MRGVVDLHPRRALVVGPEVADAADVGDGEKGGVATCLSWCAEGNRPGLTKPFS